MYCTFEKHVKWAVHCKTNTCLTQERGKVLVLVDYLCTRRNKIFVEHNAESYHDR
jgi:hypothetical protein